ncbi:MAG: TIM barrel protein [Pseudomonadota bacterium]|nr:TIM barrel protein [Pseudomonadota bacterium]
MKIYVSRWSLRKSIEQRRLTLSDLPVFVTEQGFLGLELTDREIGGRDAALENLRRQCHVHGCGLIIDINCDLTLVDPAAREREIDHVVTWLARAARAGVATVRITLGGQSFSIQKLLKSGSKQARGPMANGGLKKLTAGYPVRRLSHRLRTLLPVRARDLDAKIDRAINALQVITPRAEELGVRMGIENHWGISTRPAWILRVVNAIDSPFLGACPDFGNFPRSIEPYAGLAKLLPKAVHVQAKSWRFDAEGEETTLDYARCLALVREYGYAGPITVEYEGNGDDLADCLRTKNLIERHWGL